MYLVAASKVATDPANVTLFSTAGDSTSGTSAPSLTVIFFNYNAHLLLYAPILLLKTEKSPFLKYPYSLPTKS